MPRIKEQSVPALRGDGCLSPLFMSSDPQSVWRTLVTLGSTLFITSCGSSGGPEFTIGGSVAGLTGSGLVLQDGGDDLVVTGNGSFRFATALPQGAAFTVMVKNQPVNPTQVCGVSGGSV
jgi:hypothetical protein